SSFFSHSRYVVVPILLSAGREASRSWVTIVTELPPLARRLRSRVIPELVWSPAPPAWLGARGGIPGQIWPRTRRGAPRRAGRFEPGLHLRGPDAARNAARCQTAGCSPRRLWP